MKDVIMFFPVCIVKKNIVPERKNKKLKTLLMLVNDVLDATRLKKKQNSQAFRKSRNFTINKWTIQFSDTLKILNKLIYNRGGVLEDVLGLEETVNGKQVRVLYTLHVRIKILAKPNDTSNCWCSFPRFSKPILLITDDSPSWWFFQIWSLIFFFNTALHHHFSIIFIKLIIV